jgi:HAE1 family hydrophobic/amphiphilic exporter-1
VAMTVVPLFCARYIKSPSHEGPSGNEEPASEHRKGISAWGARFNERFSRGFHKFLTTYDGYVHTALSRPKAVVGGILAAFVLSLALFPLLGLAFFPRTDAGQFVINVKAPSGTRVEITNQEIARVEDLIRKTIAAKDLKLIVSNIGVIPGFSSIYTSNSGPYTATVQVALNDGHKTSSFEYMDRVRNAIHAELPELTTYFQSGGMVDAVLNQGLPAPIDVQVSGSNLESDFSTSTQLAEEIRKIPAVSDVFIPQDLDYPSLQLNVDRLRASELGLTQKEVVDNVITALTSNGMIAPSYWIDPKSGNDYMLTVQYREQDVHNLSDMRNIPLRSSGAQSPALLDAVSKTTRFNSPSEVDHYQIQRTFDIYVNPATEDLGGIASAVRKILAGAKLPEGTRVNLRGMVQGMEASFTSFGLGLSLALVLLYLILVAQFRSFRDPILILLAVPTGIIGVLLILLLTGTTLNVMSLMGLIMMVGIVVSNSILIVEFAHRLEEGGMSVRDAIISSCRIRLRPILMTSLATVIGLFPLALKLGTGSEQYAPLARVIIGGLIASVTLTVFIVPAAYLLMYGHGNEALAANHAEEPQ